VYQRRGGRSSRRRGGGGRTEKVSPPDSPSIWYWHRQLTTSSQQPTADTAAGHYRMICATACAMCYVLISALIATSPTPHISHILPTCLALNYNNAQCAMRNAISESAIYVRISVLRAVQSSPFPFFAARRRGGTGGGLGTPGPAPGPRPRPPRPHLRKKVGSRT
jgi:hypothetical protein